jgi:hypothetical protein
MLDSVSNKVKCTSICATEAMSHEQVWLSPYLPGPSEKIPVDCPDDGSQRHEPEHVREDSISRFPRKILYSPGAQATQFPAVPLYPALHKQKLGLTLPPSESLFELQNSHIDDPVAFWYFPASQGIQVVNDVAPTAGLYVPESHRVQTLASTESLNEPGGQGVQKARFSYCPASANQPRSHAIRTTGDKPSQRTAPPPPDGAELPWKMFAKRSTVDTLM